MSSLIEADPLALPVAARDSWRTWVMTGTRRAPIDRRRIRGAHKGLKKMLVEGMSNGGDRPQYWNNFSGVMVRQGVDEAINRLPSDQEQVLKLAYFGGLSNDDIAQHLGMSSAGVQQRLRQAMATVSEFVERGRTMGFRVICGIAALLAGRWIGDGARHPAVMTFEHVARAGMVVAAGVTASAVLASHPASPAQLSPVDRGSAPQVTVSQTQVPRSVPRPNSVKRPHSVQAPIPSVVTKAVDVVDAAVSSAAAEARASESQAQKWTASEQGQSVDGSRGAPSAAKARASPAAPGVHHPGKRGHRAVPTAEQIGQNG